MPIKTRHTDSVYQRARAAFIERVHSDCRPRSRGHGMAARPCLEVTTDDLLGWVPALKNEFGSAERFSCEAFDDLIAGGLSTEDATDALEGAM